MMLWASRKLTPLSQILNWHFSASTGNDHSENHVASHSDHQHAEEHGHDSHEHHDEHHDDHDHGHHGVHWPGETEQILTTTKEEMKYVALNGLFSVKPYLEIAVNDQAHL